MSTPPGATASGATTTGATTSAAAAPSGKTSFARGQLQALASPAPPPEAVDSTATVAMLGASTVVLLCGILFAGAILPRLQPELAFGFPVPWASIFLQGTQVAGLAFLSVTIQHWVSLRWRSFSVATGVGMVGMVVGYVASMATFRTPDWPQYFPWSLPMLVLSRHPQDVEGALWFSVAIGLVVAAAGCFDFCRREVS